ncbi:MAG: NAD-dependent epimerase/dehydratase family protein [Anaerolineae bacterium]|nr:MAG: NAD-dependent epimerase/dehydratase family protein [Anaerolineae bacterium]
MTDKMVIVITGVGDYWGARLAERLTQETGYHIIGIDNEPPPNGADGLDFIEADIDNPLVAELLAREKVTVLCHLKFNERVKLDSANYERNVINTEKLLEACTRAGVENVILRSSTAVYGAHADNSAFLDENSPLRGSRSFGHTRDLVDIEEFCEENQDRFEEVGLIIYRFANIVGRDVDSPMTRFLRQKRPFVLFGFDPMIQFIHEDDVVEALAQGVMNPIPGVFNLGADGAMPLTRVMRLVRKRPTPLFHQYAYKRFCKKSGLGFRRRRSQPIEWDYLRYPLVADLTKMRETLNFYPAYTAEEALRDFAGTRGKDEAVI